MRRTKDAFATCLLMTHNECMRNTHLRCSVRMSDIIFQPVASIGLWFLNITQVMQFALSLKFQGTHFKISEWSPQSLES